MTYENFKKELEQLINKYGIDNKANIPDFILAEEFCRFIDLKAKNIDPQCVKIVEENFWELLT